MILPRFRALLLTLALGLAAAAPPSAWAAGPDATGLARAIQSRALRVPEFQYIRKEAERLGVRVWLFGGTASSLAHYVRWDLLREEGDARFDPAFYDYDFTHIYRPNQDVDVVIDGPPELAQQLQRELVTRYPHLQGSKTLWEVRPLRTGIGNKGALLGDADFVAQNSDSASTGMIELTPPPAGEAAVRDLREWSEAEPTFLRDVRDAKLHYFDSDRHLGTARYRSGDNPKIFSAVRALIKAGQYDLEIDPPSLARIRSVIAAFNPKQDLRSDYSKAWIEKNGPKLIQNALDIEKAVAMLDSVGMRGALKRIRDDASTQGSLAWWMGKEPLKSSPLATGSGKTAAQIARELKLDEVVLAHETSDQAAFESISRSPRGLPNALISRQGVVGENAAMGNGFYLRLGREGARNTGRTLRFVLDPRAVEGVDFKRQGDYYLLLNRNAIHLIPESLTLSGADYFHVLKDGSIPLSERGYFERLRRRVTQGMAELPDAEVEEIAKLVRQTLKEGKASYPFLNAWFQLPQSTRVGRDIFADVLKGDNVLFLDEEVLKLPHWSKAPEAEAVRQEANRLRQLHDAFNISLLPSGRTLRTPPGVTDIARDARQLRFKLASYYGAFAIEAATELRVGDGTDRALVDHALDAVGSFKLFHNGHWQGWTMTGPLHEKIFSSPESQGWTEELRKLLYVTHPHDLPRVLSQLRKQPEIYNAEVYQKHFSALQGHPTGDAHYRMLRKLLRLRQIRKESRPVAGACRSFFAHVSHTALMESPIGVMWVGGATMLGGVYTWVQYLKADTDKYNRGMDMMRMISNAVYARSDNLAHARTTREFIDLLRPDPRELASIVNRSPCGRGSESDCKFDGGDRDKAAEQYYLWQRTGVAEQNGEALKALHPSPEELAELRQLLPGFRLK